MFFHTGVAFHRTAELILGLQPRSSRWKGDQKDCIKPSADNATLIQFCTRATPSCSMRDVLYGVYLRLCAWKALCHPFRIAGAFPELVSSFPAAHFSAFPSAPHPELWLWCKAAAQKSIRGCQATVFLLVIDKPSLLPLLSPSPLKKRGFIFQGFARGKYLIGLSLGKWNKESDL